MGRGDGTSRPCSVTRTKSSPRLWPTIQSSISRCCHGSSTILLLPLEQFSSLPLQLCMILFLNLPQSFALQEFQPDSMSLLGESFLLRLSIALSVDFALAFAFALPFTLELERRWRVLVPSSSGGRFSGSPSRVETVRTFPISVSRCDGRSSLECGR